MRPRSSNLLNTGRTIDWVLMKRGMPSLCAVLALGAAYVATQAAPEPAWTADRFVDFIGVNTQLGYSDTVYRELETVIRPRLLDTPGTERMRLQVPVQVVILEVLP